MSTLPSFTGPDGSDPVAGVRGLSLIAVPTIGDALEAGQIARTRIITRTLSGVSPDGSQFAPYSKAYAKFKAKMGAQSTVNLFGVKRVSKSGYRSGGIQMLNTRLVKCGGFELGQNDVPPRVDVPTDLFEVGLYGEEAARGRFHNEGTRRMPRRHWLDVNSRDIEEMIAAISARIRSRVYGEPV